MIIIEIITALAAAISAIIAAYALIQTKKYQKEIKERERKQATIDAYRKLQEDVLDKLVLCSKDEVKNVIENLDMHSCEEAYNDYRALIARCEHFAVGINVGIYDFEVFDKLGGLHIIYLYEKVKPMIMEVRKRIKTEVPYIEFEKLYKTLKEKHQLK
ncbi:MAG: DUF4760 domain-containing protein [Clostridia bacterium]|nr:DUF4760 domain-containing protein [Clostridia bacterium]